MLLKVFYNVVIICDKAKEDDAKKLEGELRHAISHSMHNIIVESVDWEQTEGVLPLTENDEEN